MKKILLEYILKNKKNFIIIVTLFCIGIAIGIFLVNNSEEAQKQELNTYVSELIKNIKEKNDINKIELLIISVKQNVSFILVIFFLGCTIIGGLFIYVAVIYKGFAIGYTISALIAVLGIKSGSIISLIALLLQNVVFLPACFIVAESGIKLYKGIFQRTINLKEEIFKHIIIMFIAVIIAIISSFIEVYISTNLLIFLKEIL